MPHHTLKYPILLISGLFILLLACKLSPNNLPTPPLSIESPTPTVPEVGMTVTPSVSPALAPTPTSIIPRPTLSDLYQMPLDGKWNVTRVHIKDDVAYLCISDYLLLADVSIPTHPTTLGVYLSSGCVDIDVEDNVAYLADGEQLRIIDVHDPTNPVDFTRYGEEGVRRVVVTTP